MRSHWTLGKKLGAAFLMVTAITLALGIVGYYGAVQGTLVANDLGTVRLPSVENLAILKQAATATKARERTLLAQGLDAASRQRQYAEIAGDHEQAQAAWKAYEALPRGAEELELWKAFVPLWNAWRTESDKFVEFSQAVDKCGIQDVAKLCHDLELFRGDHYKLGNKVLTMLRTHEAFDGGEDHTQCNFGKWLATFSSENPTLQSEMKAVAEPPPALPRGLREDQAACQGRRCGRRLRCVQQGDDARG
jgi:methyl-accepting chemotaxis protein